MQDAFWPIPGLISYAGHQPGDGDCCLMHEMESAGFIHTVGWQVAGIAVTNIKISSPTTNRDHTQVYILRSGETLGMLRCGSLNGMDIHCYYSTNLETKNKLSISVKPLQKRIHHHHLSTSPCSIDLMTS